MRSVLLGTLTLATCVSMCGAGEPVVVRDIQPARTYSNSVPTLVERSANGRVLFFAYSASVGWEPWSTSGAAGDVELVRDIQPGNGPSNISHWNVNFAGLDIFKTDDGVHGAELWRSDGTSNGTRLVRDINPGPGTGVTSYIGVLGNAVLFIADDGVHGAELWRSDGQTEGTFLVADIKSGAESSNIARIAQTDSVICFLADDGVHGRELWRTDGSGPGTFRLTEIGAGAASGTFASSYLQSAAFNGLVFFQARSATGGPELWATDGSIAGTRVVHAFPAGSSSYWLDSLIAGESLLYLAGWDPANGWEPWRSDGTDDGTCSLGDLSPGSASSNPGGFFSVGTTVYFKASNGTAGPELWATRGTPETTVFLGDIWPGSTGASVLPLAGINGTLLFRAQRPSPVTGSSEAELWRSDGTPEGTFLFKDLNPSGGSNPGSLVQLNDSTWLFSAFTNDTGYQIWRTDGTSQGTVPVGPTGSFTSTQAPYFLAVIDGVSYWSFNDGVTGLEPWRSDGTPEGTFQLADLNTQSSDSDPAELVNVGGSLFFTADDGSHGRELWRTDGTEEQTRLVSDIQPGSSPSNPQGLVATSDRVFFTAYDGTNGREPWASGGTEAGTQLLEVLPGAGTPTFSNFARLGDSICFGVRNAGTAVNGLYRSDGTPSGTVRYSTTGASILTPFQDQLAVGADQGICLSNGADPTLTWLLNWTSQVNTPTLSAGPDRIMFAPQAGARPTGSEPWFSDGTPTGTYQLADLWAGGSSSDPREFVELNGLILFTAIVGIPNSGSTLGRELCRTNGTPQGTGLLKDLSRINSNPTSLTRVGSLVLFAATDDINGTELWRTDGTADGTWMLKDICIGPNSSGPTNFAMVNGTLFFSADDGVVGRELWMSDGTADGTRLACDIWPGEYGSDPSRLVGADAGWYLAATSASGGAELMLFPVTTPGNACHAALPLTLGPASLVGDTRDATPGITPTCGDSGLSSDMWYRLDITEPGTWTIDTFGSTFDTVLSLHRSCSGRIDQVVACNDDAFVAGGPSRLVLTYSSSDIPPGGTLSQYLRVGGHGLDTGIYQLHIRIPVDCNANGVDDYLELAAGTAFDANGNDRLDDCECLADWNSSGLVSVEDIFAFLRDWFAGSADADHSGSTSVQDIFAFLALYFSGCS